MNILLTLLIALLATIIGAVPFGLVNLTVLHVAYRNGKLPAMRVAHGAAWVEIVFAMVAFVAGSYIRDFTQSSSIAQVAIAAIPIVAGVVFWFKKSTTQSPTSTPSFLKGVVLNLISVQVLFYWIIAMAFIQNQDWLQFNSFTILLFVTGVWLGKMMVLGVYAYFSTYILSKSRFLSENMNKVIGVVLLLSGLLQFLK